MNVRVQKAGVGDVKGGLRVQRLLGPMNGRLAPIFKWGESRRVACGFFLTEVGLRD